MQLPPFGWAPAAVPPRWVTEIDARPAKVGLDLCSFRCGPLTDPSAQRRSRIVVVGRRPVCKGAVMNGGDESSVVTGENKSHRYVYLCTRGFGCNRFLRAQEQPRRAALSFRARKGETVVFERLFDQLPSVGAIIAIALGIFILGFLGGQLLAEAASGDEVPPISAEG